MKKKKSKFYVYILKCNDFSYYVGFTHDLFTRVKYHYLGEGPTYTRKRLPVELVFYLEFSNKYDALETEKQIKSWSRKKKKAFIDKDFELFRALSKNSYHKKNYLKIHIPDELTNYE